MGFRAVTSQGDQCWGAGSIGPSILRSDWTRRWVVVRRAILVIALGGALMFAGASVAKEPEQQHFCRAYGNIPGIPSERRGDFDLFVDWSAAEREREGHCFLSHFAQEDRERVDGVLFDDCVIWWFGGERSTAEREGIEC